jgi:hypothetical protein
VRGKIECVRFFGWLGGVGGAGWKKRFGLGGRHSLVTASVGSGVSSSICGAGGVAFRGVCTEDDDEGRCIAVSIPFLTEMQSIKPTSVPSRLGSMSWSSLPSYLLLIR